jgi:large subunit ribosomal protein L25
MAQQQISIEVNTREAGHRLSQLRRTKGVPGVVYGPKITNMVLSLAENDAVRYSRHNYENAIFTLKSQDGKLNGLKVLKKSVTYHPVTRKPIHIDFFAPDMTKSIRVSVDLRFEGKAAGLADGGIFNAVRREIEIECLPTAIPDFISVDVSGLGIDESLHVSDIQIPESVKLITSREETIATVSIVAEEVVAAPVVAAADATAAAGAATAAPGAAPAAAGADAKKDAGSGKKD